MQYHALSCAKQGFNVDLIGYEESPIHPDIVKSPNIQIVPLQPTPQFLITKSRALFLVFGPIKVIFQILSLAHALLIGTEAPGWLLVQNPPSIPTLAVAQLACFLRPSRLVIDWHNLGFSILALRLGQNHPFVAVSRFYERIIAKNAHAHFCVTNVMGDFLRREWGLSGPIVAVHDRPAAIFKPIGGSKRSRFLERLVDLGVLDQSLMDAMTTRKTKLIVSATSWTPDEDFSILLEALGGYSDPTNHSGSAPRLCAIITGKGPQRAAFESQVQSLQARNELRLIDIKTFFFDDISDYAALLGCAELGISLHTSSSGLDLPMKVVDMFGAGLPVAGWADYKAWSELVKEGVNGLGFKDSKRLESILLQLFSADNEQLLKLQEGALRESQNRWSEEWQKTAGQILKPIL